MIHHSPVSPECAKQRMVRWAAVTAVGAVGVTALAIYSLAAISRQDEVIDRQNDVIAQVCRVAGGRVEGDPSTRLYCERVASGLPAVDRPVDVVAPPTGVTVCPSETDGGTRGRPAVTTVRRP